MKKQKYSVIEERTLEKIIQNVNTRIEEGWLPLGGVAMRYSVWEGNVYVQSLISIEEEEENDADDEMDTEETSIHSEDDDDQISQGSEEEDSSEADNDANEDNVEEVEEVEDAHQIDTEIEASTSVEVQLPPPVKHTAFCRKYNYVDCNCDSPVINGVRPRRNLTLTDSDDERVSSGIDIQAASYCYN